MVLNVCFCDFCDILSCILCHFRVPRATMEISKLYFLIQLLLVLLICNLNLVTSYIDVLYILCLSVMYDVLLYVANKWKKIIIRPDIAIWADVHHVKQYSTNQLSCNKYMFIYVCRAGCHNEEGSASVMDGCSSATYYRPRITQVKRGSPSVCNESGRNTALIPNWSYCKICTKKYEIGDVYLIHINELQIDVKQISINFLGLFLFSVAIYSPLSTPLSFSLATLLVSLTYSYLQWTSQFLPYPLFLSSAVKLISNSI